PESSIKKKFDEAHTVTDGPGPGAPRQFKEMEMRGEEMVAKIVRRELASFAKGIGYQLKGVEKFVETRTAAEKRATADARIRALVVQGKVLPAEAPSLLRQAMILDAETVRKFGENHHSAFD